MKKINAIVKGINDASERKANRIIRQVEQAIDMAKDSAQDAKDHAEEIMSSLGQYGEASQTASLADRLNDYKDSVITAKRWGEVAEVFTDLKSKLLEDIAEE